jgi:hypothetical protein
MLQEPNQQPKVSLETSAEKSELEEAAVIPQELSINVNSQTASIEFQNNGEDRLKAIGRLMMVSLTWSLAGISKRK